MQQLAKELCLYSENFGGYNRTIWADLSCGHRHRCEATLQAKSCDCSVNLSAAINSPPLLSDLLRGTWNSSQNISTWCRECSQTYLSYFFMTVIRIWGFCKNTLPVLLCGRRDCRESLLLQQLDLNFLPQSNPLGPLAKITASLSAWPSPLELTPRMRRTLHAATLPGILPDMRAGTGPASYHMCF